MEDNRIPLNVEDVPEPPVGTLVALDNGILCRYIGREGNGFRVAALSNRNPLHAYEVVPGERVIAFIATTWCHPIVEPEPVQPPPQKAFALRVQKGSKTPVLVEVDPSTGKPLAGRR